MLLSWLLNPGEVTPCCTRNPKGSVVSCLRGGDKEGGDIVEYSSNGTAQRANEEVDAGLPGLLPAGPAERMVPTYVINQETRASTAHMGDVLYCGDILQLTPGNSIQTVRLCLHVKGFTVQPRQNVANPGANTSSEHVCRVWSPFSLVEKTQAHAKADNEQQWAIFKLTVFKKEGQDSSLFFATAGSDAQSQRTQWVHSFSHAITNLTQSLFPPFNISVEPVPGRLATSTRIMAGYLLQGGANDRVSLVFCELHAYHGREARLAVYRDEWCEQEVMSIPIQDTSAVSTRKGMYCTVFGVNEQLFAARTEDERELWLRAISNVKVKLMFDAPTPTPEELQVFRSAVHERVEALPVPTNEIAGLVREQEPVLDEVQRKPPPGPVGDAMADPEPIPEDKAGEEIRSFASLALRATPAKESVQVLSNSPTGGRATPVGNALGGPVLGASPSTRGSPMLKGTSSTIEVEGL